MDTRYYPNIIEPQILSFWQEFGIYHYDPSKDGEVFSIDTPPPTVSGNLHMGHIYSYTHADIIARFMRMQGYKVFYPMGFDDNGLPTDRLVEKKAGKSANDVGRLQYKALCMEISTQFIEEYSRIMKRIGLSYDEHNSYRTIDQQSQRLSQWSFIELYNQDRIYRQYAPAIWCSECHTSIAQADLEDQPVETEYIFLPFQSENEEKEGQTKILTIATTRPELLAACVAVLIHPDDIRYRDLTGSNLIVPLYNQSVPIIADPAVDPQKGSGIVMCCTFGDITDVHWWRKYDLPQIDAIDFTGRLRENIAWIGGLPVIEARSRIIKILDEKGLLLDRQKTKHELRIHERCKLPVEYTLTQQWFVRILDDRKKFADLGKTITWYPDYMEARFLDWIENLGWDWCISRQRAYGVPIPVWYCQACGEVILADHNQIPVDPVYSQPARACQCGNNAFLPEIDVMDTWATSSLSPQLATRWQPDSQDSDDNFLFQQVTPLSLRPHSQEIIRTWDFYTIVKSFFHLDKIPWNNVLISGWGLAGTGMGKISKSRQSQVKTPDEMINAYSADAIRYWAASTGPGKDSLISEEKIAQGNRFITKLWNITLFCHRFLSHESPGRSAQNINWSEMTLADRWILGRLQKVVRSSTILLNKYEYAAAKFEIEAFFWQELADNYLEMVKQRLYDPLHPCYPGARFTIHIVLTTMLKLLAPFLPYVTEQIYQELFARHEDCQSIHISPWPLPDIRLEDPHAEQIGELLISIASAVRRYKSEHSLPLGTEINRLQLAFDHPQPFDLTDGLADLASITRARSIEICQQHNLDYEICHCDYPYLTIALEK